MHEQLLKVVRRLESDYKPFGIVSQEEAPDCSCGCRYFVKLAHDIGNDWGICSNAASPRAGLLTFEHQGCQAFEAITLDHTLADSQLRQIIAEASELLKVRRRERSVTVETQGTSLPINGGEYTYDVKTSYFPRIKGHVPTIFRIEKHDGGFVAIPLEARLGGKERPVVIARECAKNGEVFKIVRENGEFSYQVPFDGKLYNLKQNGDFSEISLADIETLRPFLESVEVDVFEKVTADANVRLENARRNLEESRDRLRRWRQKQFWANEIPANKREQREILKEEEESVEHGPSRIVELEAFVQWLNSIERSNPSLTSIPSPPPQRSGRR